MVMKRVVSIECEDDRSDREGMKRMTGVEEGRESAEEEEDNGAGANSIGPLTGTSLRFFASSLFFSFSRSFDFSP